MMGPPKITTGVPADCAASELFGGIRGGYEWTNRVGLVGHRVSHSTRPGRSDGSASLPSTKATKGSGVAGSARRRLSYLQEAAPPQGCRPVYT